MSVIAELDEAIARHCEKWMKLSKDKLRDRVDQWVAKFDPAGVRVPPMVDEGRYIEVSPGASAGMAFANGHIRAEDGAALDQGLDALAATVCEHDPRTHDAASLGCVRSAGSARSLPGVFVRARGLHRRRRAQRSGDRGDSRAR